MAEIGLLKFLHVLCLVYWLGADLAVFYSSYFVADDKLSAETRASMSKLLFALDLGPRICMPLMLGSGVHLAWRLGLLNMPTFAVLAAWLVCVGWVAMVLAVHAGGAGAKALTVIDYWFRVAVVAAIGAYSIYALAADLTASWLAYKLLVYAGLVACGLMIRRRLRHFGPALSALLEDRVTEGDNRTIRHSLAGTRPYALAIWAGLLVNTALGLHLL